MRISFSTKLKKFGSQGEKTGWTYFSIPKKIADKLNPGVRTSYRVKGKIDAHEISGVAIIPIGEGDFIFAVNAGMRKAIRKQAGAEITVELSIDTSAFVISKGLIECLADEPDAMKFFNALLPSHKRYFSKWIEEAKTEQTRIKRIARAVDALSKRLGYSDMLRMGKGER